MRINLPVNQSEYKLQPDQTLVTTTDLKGRILYANAAFVDVSGFSRDELIGQPHNLIRHPDMPEEAFRDMWNTIQKGEPWTGMVKNRRKSGDHYWVRANVTPLMGADKPVGYLSVRTFIRPDECAQAEALYRRMREEAKTGRPQLSLSGGEVQLNTAGGRLMRALTPGLQTRLGLIVGFCGGVCAVGALIAAPQATGLWAWLLVSGIAMAASGLSGGWMVRRLTIVPMNRLLGSANRMAAGDLTQHIRPEGQGVVGRIAKALAQLNVNLLSIARDARMETEHMRTSSREISSGNVDLSTRTEAQAGSLAETAAAMEEITGTVRQSTVLATNAAELAQETTHAAQRSQEAVDNVGRTMQSISESSQRIHEIISVIDSIAFQTNILALNAAVEAARAGENGRGFAVVAAEVRALSQRTTNAAREITQLIQTSSASVDEGARLTAAARETMHEALERVHRMDNFISEISSASREQLLGISQVNQAVNHLETLTQQNAALVEQVAASAISLGDQSDAVSHAVGIFRLDGQPQHVPDAVALRRNAKAAAAAAADS